MARSSADPVADGAGEIKGAQALSRALSLLEGLAAVGGEATISALAEAQQLPLPTIHRLLQALISNGFVSRTPSRKYSLGPQLIRLGQIASQALGGSMQGNLISLADATGETANMACLDSDLVVYIAQAQSRRYSMRTFTEVGHRVYAHCSAMGKAILSQLPESEVRAMMERTGMPAQTPSTITDLSVLMGQLRQIREQGYALDEEEHEVGVRCVAAPIRVAALRSAISVSGLYTRFDQAAVQRFIPLVCETAEEITRMVLKDAVTS